MHSRIALVFYWMILIHSVVAQSYEEGKVYFSSNEYVEYLKGNLPIVISVPHGGEKRPLNIPDRECAECVIINDAFTQELARELTKEINDLTGCYPHVIINRLHRSKLDANRNQSEGADGNIDSEEAWDSYHEFIDTSINYIADKYLKGLFIDLHGHGHDLQRLELGYLLTKADLAMNNDHLNKNSVIERSSIKSLANDNLMGVDHAQLIRGENSLGTLLEMMGYASLPSEPDPSPIGSEPYFRGGHNTERYGSKDGSTIDGIQIECHQEVRFEVAERRDFAKGLALALLEFLELHYFSDFSESYCITTSTEKIPNVELSIFPNPVSTYVNIESDATPVNILIFDLMGNLVKSHKIDEHYEQLDLSLFSPGVYFLIVIGDNRHLKALRIIKL